MASANASEQLSFLLETFASKTAGVRSVLVSSKDGLELAAHNLVEDGISDRLSAVTSGLFSLTKGVGSLLDGDGTLKQNIAEFAGGFLFVVPGGPGANVTVLTDPSVDIGQIGFDIQLLVKQVSHALSVEARHPQARSDGQAG
ncbi:roadblock/LC7 domain-containing protein [Streptomyces sp. 8L]|uniref:roadblock/LC7 domain-containing protein n=1 Tax=Streptomyces sp. 8L TaxID=2877242 RepID=UPI001CD372CB|nr:roadblock/LC7 domain-containing protein [Streptomyces sp. 8L]MCA1220043.1 roadblock/LC7 domain-containing protein [Streptomyces sp. 8L]